MHHAHTRRGRGPLTAALIATLTLTHAGTAAGATDPETEERIEKLERQVEILSEELEGARREYLVSGEYDSMHGVGPAGSKVYGRDSGLAIGGYGEGYFRSSTDAGADRTDFYRQIFYFGYRFNDKWLLNTEIEFEHVDEVFLEFAYLDYLHSEALNARAGLMLTPMGFINEVHEPPFYFGNFRPTVERQIIPTTSRENGAGIYGRLAEQLEYRLYVQNSFDGMGLSAANLRDIRQKGSKASAEDLSVVGRLDWKPASGITLGGSYLTGDLGQNQTFAGQTPSVPLDLYEVHAEYKRGGWWLRALFAQADIGDTLPVTQHLNTGGRSAGTIGETMTGWYAEAGYDIFRLLPGAPADQSLYPWVRYSTLDTQDSLASAVTNAGFSKDPKNDREVVEVGLHYMPHPNIVLKTEYRDWSSEDASGADGTNNQEEFLVGIGYNF